MGLLARAVNSLAVPEFKQGIRRVAATIPTWQANSPQFPQNTRAYERLARQAYLGSEIIFAAIEAKARTAATPRMVCFKEPGKNAEMIDDDPSLAVLNKPNPFMTHFMLWANTVVHLHVAGNAYWERVRNRRGNVIEYWLMRPDRLRVIPDQNAYIGGYEYQLGAERYLLKPEDVLHFKTKHPLDDYYGLPIIAPLAERADVDVWAREFTLAFFRNAGVPSGLLNIMRAVDNQERELIKQRFRQQYGGPQGWGNVLVIDNGEATYTPMGMGPGADGLALSQLNEVSEARVAAVIDVPPSITWTVLGHKTGTGMNNSNKQSDREEWWSGSLKPMYEDLAQQYTLLTAGDFPGIDRFEFDLSQAPGLSKDEDAETDRVLKTWSGSLRTWKESRLAAGMDETPDEGDDSMVLVPAALIPTPWKTLAEPAPAPPTQTVVEQPARTEPPESLPGGRPSAGALPAPGARPANGTTDQSKPGIKRVVRSGEYEFKVLDGCGAEQFGEHWCDADTGVCMWCGQSPQQQQASLETKDLNGGLDADGGVFVPPQIAPARRRRKPQTGTADDGGYDYQSTQVNLPDELARLLVEWAHGMIAADDLAEGGLETQPHVTVCFGLSPDVTADDVRRVVAAEPPISARFGMNAAFSVGASGVPLYVQVDSPDLHRLHGMLKAALPNVQTHLVYQPHVTLAYVTPESAHKYVGGNSTLAGQGVTFDAVSFRNLNGEEEAAIPLDGHKLLASARRNGHGIWVP